jgi:hypothetical protein
MIRALGGWAVPSYVLLSLFLGGSSNSLWQSAVLHLLGIFIIAWAAVQPKLEPRGRDSRALIGLIAAALAVVLVQLIPLPPELWRSLPGREPIVQGYDTLGYPLSWLPLSWAPYRTLQSAYALIPPVAVIVAIIAVRAHRERWVAGAVIVGALASVVLGSMQMASAGPQSWVYIYKYTNPGAVGFFANRNHMATLLLGAVPFAAALFAAGHPHIRNRTTALAIMALGAGSLLLILIGMALNG